MFIGREKELHFVHQFFQDQDFGTLLLYGRRKIGKTTLLKAALEQIHAAAKDTKVMYYECKQTSEENNVGSFSEIIAQNFPIFGLTFSSMEQALKYIFEMSVHQPVILVLDEYPYLRLAIKGLDSILQVLIDTYQERSQCKMILSGSYIDVMRSLVDVQNPLHGRITRKLEVQPMDYFESAMFYPEFSHADKIRLYSVFGGVPYYNRLINPSLSVKENIQALVTSENARLDQEIPQLLKAELNKITYANEVFECMAAGVSKFKEIQSKAHIPDGKTLSLTLTKLIDMNLIRKEAPINDERNPKKTRYLIDDPLASFFYRYIFPNQSKRNVLTDEAFYKDWIEKDFETQYVPHQFELICRQFLIRQNKKGKMNPMFFSLGRYYYDDPVHKSNGEFDNVSQDANGYSFFESKFRNQPVSKEMITEEISQVLKTGLAAYRFGFISKSGFDEDVAENERILLYTLDDLFADDLK